MGTGTAVAKPSPRCIAETEDGRGRAAGGNSRGRVTLTRGQVQPDRQAIFFYLRISLEPDLDLRVIALCPRCIGPGDRLFLVYFDRIGADKTS